MTTTAIGLDSIVRASSRQVSTDLGSETVILGMEHGGYFGLNEVGTRIWDLVQAPTRVAVVCERLFSEYEVGRAALEHDVLQMLSDLHRQGLLDIVVDADFREAAR